MNTPKTPKKKGCKTCPQADPGSTESTAAPTAPQEPCGQGCACVKYEVLITAERVKVGVLNCYAGAKLKLCKGRADALVEAGMATIQQPVF